MNHNGEGRQALLSSLAQKIWIICYDRNIKQLIGSHVISLV